MFVISEFLHYIHGNFVILMELILPRISRQSNKNVICFFWDKFMGWIALVVKISEDYTKLKIRSEWKLELKIEAKKKFTIYKSSYKTIVLFHLHFQVFIFYLETIQITMYVRSTSKSKTNSHLTTFQNRWNNTSKYINKPLNRGSKLFQLFQNRIIQIRTLLNSAFLKFPSRVSSNK